MSRGPPAMARRRSTAGVIGLGAVAVLAAAAWPATLGRPAFVAAYGAAGQPLLVVGVGFGQAYAVTSNLPLGMDRRWTVAWFRPDAADVDVQRQLLDRNLTVRHGGGGFYIGVQRDAFSVRGAFYMVAAAPLWALAAVSAPWPARRLAVGMIDRRRRRRGLCRQCGYDRRGLPPGGRCPECGAVDGLARRGVH